MTIISKIMRIYHFLISEQASVYQLVCEAFGSDRDASELVRASQIHCCSANLTFRIVS